MGGTTGFFAGSLIDERYVTANNGFEVLGSNWDVYAEERHDTNTGVVVAASSMSPVSGTCGSTECGAAACRDEHRRLLARIRELEQSQYDTAIRHKSAMDALNQQASAARDRLYEADRHRLEDEARREQERQNLHAIHEKIRHELLCPICQEVALLPEVVGTCGHIICQKCVKQLDDVAFASLTSAAGGASARQHLLARRCPLCRTEIVGAGFPVLPLKQIASLLVQHGSVQVSEMKSVQKHLADNTIQYEKPSAEQQHIIDLQIGCYAQSQLAKHSVDCVVQTVTPEQWMGGVYILFESAVSRVFFETFATTLHGRAGGVNVLVNAQQRMLAVQLDEKKKTGTTASGSASGSAWSQTSSGDHLLIKVSTDGRFTVSTTPKASGSGSATTATATTPAARTT